MYQCSEKNVLLWNMKLKMYVKLKKMIIIQFFFRKYLNELISDYVKKKLKKHCYRVQSIS